MVVRPSALQRGGDKNAPQAPLERICAQYGRCFASFVSSTASDRKGFVKGESVPLDPLLPPFGGAKGGPRRVGVLTKPCKRLRDADRRLQIWSKISFTALFMGEKQALPAGGFYSAGKAARRQVRETSER